MGLATVGRKLRNVYAEGGAREARCTAKESSGEALAAGAAYLVTCCASANRARGAAAKAGTCSDWQTWQAVSGPMGCWWTKAPPAAKYNRAAQPSMAIARLPEMNLRKSICLKLHTSV